MKNKTHRTLLNLSLCLLASAPLARAQTTTFTYQGNLTDGGSPASGNYDLNFRVYDALSAGTQLPPGGPITQSKTAVPVANGLFTVSLDFGPNVFTGPRRWLEVDVKLSSSAASPVILTPRTELTPVPYAIYAQNAGAVANGAIGAAQLAADSVASGNLQSGSVTGGKIASGQVVKSLNGLTDNITLSPGANVTLTRSGNDIQIASSGGSGPFLLNGTSAYYNGGNVGIGTANPAAPIHVTGAEEGIRIEGPRAGSSGVAYMSFADSAGTLMGYVGDGSLSDSDVFVGSYLGDVVLNTPAGRVLTATASGTVGIGTTAPAAKLHVEAGSSPFAVLGVLSQGGAAVRGIDAFSDTYGELASVNESPEFRTGVAVYGHAGSNDFAGKFDGNVIVTANSQIPAIAVNNHDFFGIGVHGEGVLSGVEGFGQHTGVYGGSSDGTGVDGYSDGGMGVQGSSSTGIGVDAWSWYGTGLKAYSATWNGIEASSSGRAAIYAIGLNNAKAGEFHGDVSIGRDLSVGRNITSGGDVAVAGDMVATVVAAAIKLFKIDHPTDPANKYLTHACVESPDAKNIYDGIVTTDDSGHATVVLPDYFEALNGEFCYQLTVIGQFAQAIVSSKIANNRFTIKSSVPNVEVSWQVTGIRHDAYVKAHPVRAEQDKPEHERGYYLCPEVFGAPPEKGIRGARELEWARRVEQKRLQPQQPTAQDLLRKK